MFTSGNAQDISPREDPLLRGRPGRAAPRANLPTGTEHSITNSRRGDGMTNNNQPTDDDRTIGLTTVANPKRVRLGSPQLTDPSDRD